MYHTHHSTTTEDIKDLIKETSKVATLAIEKRSNPHAYHGSFRVSVNRTDFDEAIKPDNWPAGWSIREYFVSRTRREQEMASAQAATPTDGPNAQAAAVNNDDSEDTEMVPPSQD